ncbi:flagellar protein FlaG [bacterium]|nr:flagellar protein FlaG [bacterium]
MEQSRSQPAAFTSEHMELIQALVDRVAAYLNRRMDYQIEPKTHAVVVRILDGETQEVVKTIPPEQWIKLAQRFEETIGLLFDELA